MVRRIIEKVPDELLQKDLKKYGARAIELGATDAQIISSNSILIDERVRAKCFVPFCPSLGKNAHCPPHALELDFMRKVVSRFQYAIFYMLRVPPEQLVGPGFQDKKNAGRSSIKNWEIASQIEKEAFYDGYYLAMGFSGGPCQPYLCPNKDCRLLTEPGQGCRNPLIARPSMEGVGMNALAMAANCGWEIYPVGGSLSPADIPFVTRLGIVLIY
jgi:predicted metal-binding protein